MNYRKNGISLLVLIVTIIVALIIISTAIVSVSNVLQNNNISNFAEKMKSLEDQVIMYYIENKDIPKKDDTFYLKSEILSIVSNKGFVSAAIDEELSLNGDNTNSTEFYEIDFDKLDLQRFNESEYMYVVAMPSLHVYSLYPTVAKGKSFFSLSSKINSNKVIERNNTVVADFGTVVSNTNGLIVNKRYSNWTNKLGINIETYIDNTEKLYVAFNNKETEITTTANSNNNIYFDSLTELQNSTFTNADMLTLSSKDAKDKYIQIIKRNGADVIASVNVYLNNFDYDAPKTTNLNNVVSITNETSTLTIDVNDNISGIKEVRYEYYSTGDRVDGLLGKASYYSGVSINKEYIYINGKKAKLENGKAIIEVPRGISSVRLIIVDNASNISNAIELSTEPASEVYYSVMERTNSSVKIKFYGANFSGASYSYSNNNVSYSSSLPYTVDTVISIDNIENQTGYLYIKITSVEGVTRIMSIPLTVDNYIGTTTKNESKWYNPYIPNGFIYVSGTVDTGFVIRDISENINKKYNEFVWIPVDGNKIKYEKKEFGIGTIATFQNIVSTNKDKFQETSELNNNIIESVRKYGGFYVARYEASLNGGVLKSISSMTPKYSISYTDALNASNTMYNNSDARTTLMTAAAFDTIISFLGMSGYNVTDSENSNYSALGNYSGSIINTGSNNNYVMNNIYDFSGNLAEMTTEKFNNKVVFRGGSYSSTDTNRLCSVRAYNESTENQVTIGFRPILYIK